MRHLIFSAMLLMGTTSLTAQTLCENGFAGDYPCENVDMWAFMSIDDLGGATNMNDIWGWTDEASGREFAIACKNNGTSFVEITDPANPIYLGFLPTHTLNSLWRDAKVYADHAFIGSEASGHGMQVFDLTQLLTVSNPPVDFEETAHYGEFGNSHNIVINEETGYAYGVGTSTFNGGLHIVNIQDPANPVIAGAFAEDGYTHDAQAVVYHGPDEEYVGREIVFACNENTLTIVDVEDKSDCQLLASKFYEDNGYSHQGWLTEDHRYFLKNDELDEINDLTDNTRTFVWDVQDLSDPLLVGVYEGPATSIDHNLYVRWQQTFQSNYRSGLRILNNAKTSLGELNEIGYFDVIPGDDNQQFSGTWSNYCYFPSGTVVVTDMYNGLFILRARTASADYLLEPACFADNITTHAYIAYAAEEASVQVNGLPMGVTATVGDINLPGPIPIELEGLAGLDAGDYAFTYAISYDEQEITLEGVISIPDVEVPVIDGLSPVDADIEANDVTLSWNSNLENGDYTVQVASDDAFANIVFEETITETTIDIPFALPPGVYYWQVLGTGEGDCQDDVISDVVQFTSYDLSIGEGSMDGFVLYPNPANSVVNITLFSSIEQLDIVATDGRLVRSYAVNGLSQVTIDLSDLAAGMYMIAANNGQRQSLIKK